MATRGYRHKLHCMCFQRENVNQDEAWKDDIDFVFVSTVENEVVSVKSVAIYKPVTEHQETIMLNISVCK